MTKEGGLHAPKRENIAWQDPDFINPESIEKEMRRVFDICHGCRRCFNLCDSFPTLFDLIDESETFDVDGVATKDLKKVVDQCTLCDMCFMTKCPYVPPHEFNLDFPHLMLRHRAMEYAQGEHNKKAEQLTKTDRNAKLAAPIAPVVNWANKQGNTLTRPLMEAVTGIHRDAVLPKFTSKPFLKNIPKVEINKSAPAYGKRKAVVFVTCLANYNSTAIATAALNVLAHNGIELEFEYPGCCGMPQLEQGNIKAVAANAEKISKIMRPWVDKGYDVINLTASCGLMFKFEWPLILPEDENVKALSEATFDISEYVVDIAKNEGLADGLTSLDSGVTLQAACHLRAQNMGPKDRDMLNLIPDIDLKHIERCSGHGGSWGTLKDTHETAMKFGKPVFKQIVQAEHACVSSSCYLAALHLKDGAEKQNPTQKITAVHPIELFAKAYDLV